MSDIKAVQAEYHDWEAATYEDKFSISFDERCIGYAKDRFRKVVAEGARFDRVLEIGAGTGFFSINLALGGCLDGAELHATDISEGMLDVCARNAAEHGVEVATRVGDVEALPYDDASFDLVIGHAVLHHLPVPGLALREIHRVLAPSGTMVIAGEPTELGDRIARVVKRAARTAVDITTARGPLSGLRRPSVRAAGGTADDERLAALEHEVDLHTFRPRDVELQARLAGFVDVRVVTEELTANWFGWAVRTVEGALRPGALPDWWAWRAYRTYLALDRLDERVLRRLVPAEAFYNLIVVGRRPGVVA